MHHHLVLLAALAVLAGATARAAEPISAFRNDGTGHYPAAANPPTTWSRTSTTLAALRSIAEKPADDRAGAAMPDGVVRDWLVLGPVAHAKDADALPAEPDVAPEPDQPAAGGHWKNVSLDSAHLNFTALLGKPKTPDCSALAFTHVYSPAPAQLQLNLTSTGTVRLYVNGKKLAAPGRANVDLAAGWNRVLLRVSPGESDWYAVPVLLARGPRAEYRETNVAWRTPLPGAMPAFYGGGTGVGAPVVAGDDLYLQSEPHDLICLDKKTGRIKWLRRASFFEAATDDEKRNPAYADARAIAATLDALDAAVVTGQAKPAQLEEKSKLEKSLQKQMKRVNAARYASHPPPDVGFSGYTPATDGQFVYAWFGDGVSACVAPDGSIKWIRADPRDPVEHGFSSSPLLTDGKFVVFMRDLIAFDSATGKLLWQTPIVAAEGQNPANFIHGSPVAASIAGTKVICLGNGIVVRAADGKILTADTKADNQAVPSPVVDGDLLLHVSKGNAQLTIRPLPAALSDPLAFTPRNVPIDLSAFPKHYLPWHLSSPLIHDGLAYLLNNAGVLTVVDVATGHVCYQKLLDLDVFQGHNEGAARGVGISPALAGNHVYLFGNNGAALVIEPGRTYKQLAKNKLESVTMPGHWSQRQERFTANPVFDDGGRLYLRGEEYLYAITGR